MRQVKCWDINEKRPKDQCWQAPNKRYYSSKAAYETIEKKAELHKELLDEIAYILDYKEGQVFPTVLFKKLKEFEFYGDETILRTLKAHEQDLVWAFQSKSFQSDYNKVQYLIGAIKNHVNDVYKNEVNAKQQVKKIEKRTIVHTSNMTSIGTSKGGKDISKWLGGEDE